MYSILDFGRELEGQVNLRYDVVYLADWAHSIYMNNPIDVETASAMMPILAMGDGDQFALTKQQLLDLAKQYQMKTN